VWSSDRIEAGVAGLSFICLAKDQGWGNRKSRFALSVDNLEVTIEKPEISEWEALAYKGMLAKYTSQIFEHDFQT